MKGTERKNPPTHLEIPAKVYNRVKAYLEQATLGLKGLGHVAPEILQPRIELIRKLLFVCEGELMACTEIVKEDPR